MHAARRLGAREANLIKGNVGQQQKRAKEMEDEEFFFIVVGPCAGLTSGEGKMLSKLSILNRIGYL